MKKQPIHQNLNTSFVNVAALVRYLGGLQFVGSVRIELASYEADIVFTSSRTIQARECDHIAGRISHGKHALQRIMIRAREPHGRVHVYKFVSEGYAGQGENVFVDKSIMANARKLAESPGGSLGKRHELMSSDRNGENAAMLSALSDLLRRIELSLDQASLSFPPAFRLACESITEEYSFLKLQRDALLYRDGSVVLNAQADSETVASAVFAALRPIFGRLKSEPKYRHVFDELTGELYKASEENRGTYQKLGLIKYIHELLRP